MHFWPVVVHVRHKGAPRATDRNVSVFCEGKIITTSPTFSKPSPWLPLAAAAASPWPQAANLALPRFYLASLPPPLTPFLLFYLLRQCTLPLLPLSLLFGMFMIFWM